MEAGGGGGMASSLVSANVTDGGSSASNYGSLELFVYGHCFVTFMLYSTQ